MAKSTRKRVANVLADIANEDDGDFRPAARPERPQGPSISRLGPPPTVVEKRPQPARSADAPAPAPAAKAAPTSPGPAAPAEPSVAPATTDTPAANRPAEPAAADAPAAPPSQAAKAASRAPGLGHLLTNWGEQSREAEQWRRALEEGAVVQEIETDLVTSFRWHDRFADFDDGAEFDALVDSILREGQIAPALLRPHPEEPGKFELVYGHRRHRACAKLGRPLRAIVRPMDDETAVTFLSRENSQHAPPSFIERARQADKLLKDTGWTVQFTADVLGVQRSEVSRYRMVMTLPERLVLQIGGDPTIGRPTWLNLETLWRDKGARERITGELDRIERQAVRGQRAMRRLVAAGRPKTDEGDVFRPKGTKEAVMRRDLTASADRLIIDKRVAAGFGDFLWERLDDLWKEWHSRQK